jgi:hypothetical protein
MLSIVICSIVIAATTAVNPGAKIQANQAALNYAKGIGVEVMNKQLPGLHLPDISGQARDRSTKSISHYQLTNVILSRFTAPNSGATATLQAPRSVNLKIVGMQAYVTADYKVTIGSGWFSISKSGTVTASTSGASLVQAVAVIQAGGKPQLNSGSCAANIGNLDIEFHGDLLDDIVNLFKSYIADYVKDELNGVLCSEISTLVANEANPFLKTIPTSIAVIDGFSIDYSLTSDPVATAQAVTVNMLGQVW